MIWWVAGMALCLGIGLAVGFVAGAGYGARVAVGQEDPARW